MNPSRSAASIPQPPPSGPRAFTGYEKFIVGVLAFLQFTIILDFMVLSPLGATLIPTLGLTPRQFGWVVSAYAFSAGASGLLAAGFADRYDRKSMLLFFYTGFIVGTLLCGIATDYYFLLGARIVTGIFGGVMGSVVYAITTDTFPMQMRGRVMGFVQTSFAASQVLGIPLALYLCNAFNWHAPFLFIVGISVAVGVMIFFYMRPINSHLVPQTRSPFAHLSKAVSSTKYLEGYAATALLSTGGFMLMPFGSAFSVYNLGIDLEHLPAVYMATGICAMFAGPIAGRMSDTTGKFSVFTFGTLLTIAMVVYYTQMGISPLWLVITTNIILFVGISSRIVSAMALTSAIPSPEDRGAYMSVSSSIQQISGGLAAALAGLIVVQNGEGPLQHFDTLGQVVALAAVITLVMMYRINRRVMQ
jgi:predicted MFS family arabinose efflux permease